MNSSLKKTNIKEQAHIVTRLFRAASALNKHIDEENVIIEKGNINSLTPMLQKKIDLLNQFHSAEALFEEFIRKYEIDKSHNSLTQLNNALVDMSHLSKRNEMLLMVNMEISEQIVDHYKEVKSKQAIAKSGYNKEGKMNAAADSSKAIATVSLNNKI